MAEITPRDVVGFHGGMPSYPTPSNLALTSAPAVASSSARGAVAGWGDGEAGKLPAAAKSACLVIDTGLGGEGVDDHGSDREREFCRICHLSPGGGYEGSEMIQLGCGCKGELGIAHRHCAEAWFRVKGNRSCEICGANAKNISVQEDSRFLEEGYGRRGLNTPNTMERNRDCVCLRRQPFCNFLMACMIIAFILLWFFRLSMF